MLASLVACPPPSPLPSAGGGALVVEVERYLKTPLPQAGGAGGGRCRRLSGLGKYPKTANLSLLVDRAEQSGAWGSP
jgi:hypothetical protein